MWSSAGRSAALVLRVWTAPGQPPQLRARLLGVSDTGGELVAVTAAGSVDDICAAVRSWLDDFLAG
jgi:hypothetical protein